MEKKPQWLKVRYNQEAVDEVAELKRHQKCDSESGLVRRRQQYL